MVCFDEFLACDLSLIFLEHQGSEGFLLFFSSCGCGGDYLVVGFELYRFGVGVAAKWLSLFNVI
jgi:hypothetical protein